MLLRSGTATLYDTRMHVWHWIKSSQAYRGISRFILWYTRLLNNPSQTTRTLSLSVLLAVAFVSLLGIFEIIDPYPLKDWIYLRLTLQDLGPAGGILYIALVAVLSLISPISLFIMTGAASFGPLPGIVLSYVGAILNANLTFFLVKGLSIERAWGADRRSSRIKRAIQDNGYPLVLILQLLTLIPFIAINSAAAASGVSWKDFMRATSMGILPCIFIYSFLGDLLVSAFLTPRVYFAFLCVVAVCLIVMALKKGNAKLRGKRQD